MEIKESRHDDILVLSLEGRLDSTTSPHFEQEVLARITENARLVLDFSQLEYISSAGLRVLLMAAKRTKQANGRLVHCALREPLREVFEISGFLSILDVRPSLAEALADSAR